jgi:CRISPR-associated protein Cas2
VIAVADEVGHYVVCYDVPDDVRRTRLAKLLDGYGVRVQYSVFEAVLDRGLFDKLVEELRAILDPQTDRVTIYIVCASCARKRLPLGLAAADWPERAVVYLV